MADQQLRFLLEEASRNKQGVEVAADYVQENYTHLPKSKVDWVAMDYDLTQIAVGDKVFEFWNRGHEDPEVDVVIGGARKVRVAMMERGGSSGRSRSSIKSLRIKYRRK